MSLLEKLAQLKGKAAKAVEKTKKKVAKLKKRRHNDRQLMLPFPDGPAFDRSQDG